MLGVAGESGADVYDRITIFEDHLINDIDNGIFPEEANLIMITHGLTMRIFLARWFHWTVSEFEVRNRFVRLYIYVFFVFV